MQVDWIPGKTAICGHDAAYFWKGHKVRDRKNRLKKGKHYAKCMNCGVTGLRGNSAQLCHRGGRYWRKYRHGDTPYVYDCRMPITHMPETCRLLGGACSSERSVQKVNGGV